MDVLAISDQPLAVLALRALLRQISPPTQVFQATHLGEAMTMLAQCDQFGMHVLDLDTHGVRGSCTPALLRQMSPTVPLVLLASHERNVSIAQATELGASGYIFKTESAENLRRAFATLLAGETYGPEPVLCTDRVLCSPAVDYMLNFSRFSSGK